MRPSELVAYSQIFLPERAQMRLVPKEAQANAESSAKALDGPVPPLPGWTTQVHIGADAQRLGPRRAAAG